MASTSISVNYDGEDLSGIGCWIRLRPTAMTNSKLSDVAAKKSVAA